ncbi:hypothetical protein [Clostridium sp.]|uniref:hypothetical protein n=1 Tax=Clostridium sp. TaxID=1506 RepID=UPI001B56A784|nr:hypothetical protein [Clostridium sp.]MBP3916697.1 hypothetical protein [Clostridium sp.]
MLKKLKIKSFGNMYIIDFLIINCIGIIGGFTDGICWGSYAKEGGLGGFPVFTLYSIVIGAFIAAIFNIFYLRKYDTDKEKTIHYVLAIASMFMPNLVAATGLVGVLIGWLISLPIVRLM